MVYFNNASTTYPKPKSVIKSVISNIKKVPSYLNHSISNKNGKNIISESRKKIAKFFNTDDPNNIIFTSGATESLNLVIKGLPIKDSNVITTSIEHNSVLRPIRMLEKENQTSLTIIDCDSEGRILVRDIEKAIKPNTKAIIVNHCSNVTGNITDIRTISEIAHRKNIFFVVDASLSAGCFPIDVTKENIDFLIFTGHKFLYGISGIGGLYIRKSLDINPLKVGDTGDIFSEDLLQPHNRPTYYEAGTQNLAGIVSLNSGISFIEKIGFENIRKKKEMLYNRLIQQLEEQPRIIIYGNKHLKNKEPLISFNIKGMPPSDVGFILGNVFEIIVGSGMQCSPLIHKSIGSYPNGVVRVSFSHFNTIEEIDYLVNALKQIINAQNIRDLKKKNDLNF